MFESLFGEKEFYLNGVEKELFGSINLEEKERIRMYQDNLKQFKMIKLGGLLREILELSIEILYKIVFFPFNFTYFDYSAESKLNDISIVIFPEQIVPLITDFEFYGLLHQYFLGCKF